jgi:hypothetical protein
VRRVGEMEERYTKEVMPIMAAIQKCKAAIEAAGGRWPDAVLLPGPGALGAAAREELMAHMRVRGASRLQRQAKGCIRLLCAADKHAPPRLPAHCAFRRNAHSHACV